MRSHETGQPAIAILGMGCRFPGASDPESFWKMLTEGRNARGPVPLSRYDVNAYYHPDQNSPGATIARDAHFIFEDVNAFDAPFFSINPKEANSMDPQQRLLLEVTYEALENGGLSPRSIQGSDTSCFIGAFTTDFRDNMLQDIEATTEYTGAGCSNALLSNRISWFYDLHGPSMTIDTACSSSLSALHLACQSLLTGESNVGIVGGTSLMLGPSSAVSMSAAHLLSPGGASHAFDHRANGYGRGEGVGVIVIKRLEDALRDGDTIRAIIRSTCSNQDGRTPGVSHPSSAAQKALIKKAYHCAGLDTRDTAYIEAHGTGTKTGDPIEMTAIIEGFANCSATSRTVPLFVGSVKTNVGHMEGAAGMASIIKSVLMVENGLIPPSLGFEKLNPRISEFPEHMRVPTQLEHWPISTSARRVSINSFGFGGANVHIILEQAPQLLDRRCMHYYGRSRPDLLKNTVFGSASINQLSPRPSIPTISTSVNTTVLRAQSSRSWLLPLTSHDEHGVARYASKLVAYIQKAAASITDDQDAYNFMDALVNTLAHRAVHPWRSFTLATSLNDLETSLTKIPAASRITTSTAKISVVAFVFTGQGAQWWAMGRELSEQYATYGDSIQLSSRYLRLCGASWDLEAELGRDEATSRLHEPGMAQPACTAIQIALIHLTRLAGVEPIAVLGHSSGEIAAAYAAGEISHAYTIKVTYYRGYYADRLRQQGRVGAMAAVNLGQEEVERYLERMRAENRDLQVVVACINSLNNCTVSGDKLAIDSLLDQWHQDKVRATKLKIDVAYHSPHMTDISESYATVLASDLEDVDGSESATKPTAKTSTRTPTCMISSLTGSPISPGSLNASYWVQNLISPVQFCKGVEALLQFIQSQYQPQHRSSKNIITTLVEIGPHSALRKPVMDGILARIAPSEQTMYRYASLLRRDNPADRTFLGVVGELFQAGGDANMIVAANSVKDAVSVRRIKRHRLPLHPRNGLLGSLVNGSGGSCWRKIIKLQHNSWLGDHRINTSIIYPTAGYIAMAIEAARYMASLRTPNVVAYELTDIFFVSALSIPEDGSVEILTEIHQPFTSRVEFLISSGKEHDGRGQLHCRGFIEAVAESPEGDTSANYHIEAGAVQTLCTTPAGSFYETLNATGVNHGPSFRNLTRMFANSSWARANICIPDTAANMPLSFETDHLIHPTSLDSFLQLGFLSVMGMPEPLSAPLVPSAIERLWISTSTDFRTHSQRFNGHASSQLESPGCWSASIFAALENDAQEAPHIVLEGLQIRSLSGARKMYNDHNAPVGSPNLCWEMRWIPDIDFLASSSITSMIFKSQASESDDQDLVAKLEEYLDLYLPDIVTACDNLASTKHHQFTSPHFDLWWQWLVQRAREKPASKELERAYSQTNLANEIKASTSGSIWVRVLQMIGSNFGSIISGEIEPLQLLLQDDILSSLYRYGFGTSGNESIAQYIRLLSAKRYSTTILELGGGTASTTGPILQQAGDQISRYVFTDISPGFLSAAANKLGAFDSILDFATLDIERDPVEQGFQLESFDIIVAANVLHATRNISQTLAHVSKLLRPGGKLLLLELTLGHTAVSLVMGSLPGWWLGEDDGRKGGPLMSVDQWNASLKDAGFSGIDLQLRGSSHLSRSPLTFLVSTKSEAAAPEEAIPRKLSIISGSNPVDQGLSKDLQRIFVALGSQNISVCTLDSPASDGTFCVVLLENSDAFLSKISDQDFIHFQALIQRSSGMLWVTRGATGECAAPHRSLILGLARSVRNERAGYHLAVLDLDLEGEGPRVTKAIVEVALKVMRDPRGDHEYAFRQGQILIPRVSATEDLSQLIVSGSMSEPRSTQTETNSIFKDDSSISEPTTPRSTITASEMGSLSDYSIIQASEAATATNPINIYVPEDDELSIQVDEHVLPKSHEKMPIVSQDLHLASDCQTTAVKTGEFHSPISVNELRLKLRSNASYMIAGLGGAGRNLAWWLAEQGATHLVLVSRSAATGEENISWVAKMKQSFSRITISAWDCDVGDRDALAQVVATTSSDKHPRIAGVIMGAMEIQDALFEAMSPNTFKSSLHPKVNGSWNLHELLPSDLDFFVMLSSIIGVTGLRGQANYNAGNVFQDSLAHYRVGMGRRAMSIDLGYIPDVGFITTNDDYIRTFKTIGIQPIHAHEVQNLVALASWGSIPDRASGAIPPQIITGLPGIGGADELRYWACDAKFWSHGPRRCEKSVGDGTTESMSESLYSQLQEATSIEHMAELAEKGLTGEIARLMTIAPADVDTDKSLDAHGVDSLVAVEVRNWIVTELGVELSVLQITGNIPIMGIAQLMAARFRIHIEGDMKV